MRSLDRQPLRGRAVFVRLSTACIAAALLAACAPDPAAQVAAGRELFAAQGCAACHGPEGHGGGPFRAADLHNRTSFTRGASISEIEATLVRGLPPRMPSFSYLSNEERHLLAIFVSSLADEAQGVKTP